VETKEEKMIPRWLCKITGGCEEEITYDKYPEDYWDEDKRGMDWTVSDIRCKRCGKFDPMKRLMK
jgi:hypothetical protein